ncbi:odorant receptor Or2-like [Prorops nasuta]|uniref:odorant receptor Or2-like n=1 Tax=Prorops nasuta TaxID=863751 RepID=UPI0034CDB961
MKVHVLILRKTCPVRKSHLNSKYKLFFSQNIKLDFLRIYIKLQIFKIQPPEFQSCPNLEILAPSCTELLLIDPMLEKIVISGESTSIDYQNIIKFTIFIFRFNSDLQHRDMCILDFSSPMNHTYDRTITLNDRPSLLMNDTKQSTKITNEDTLTLFNQLPVRSYQKHFCHLNVTMDFFDSSYYKVQKALLTLSGAWPYQDNNCKSFFSRLINIQNNLNSFDAFMECLPLFTGSIICFCKGCFLYFNDIKILLEDLKEDWKYCEYSEAELAIIKEYAELSKLITIIHASSMQLMVASYYISSCVSPVLDLVLPLNESRPRTAIFPGDLYVHTEGHFFLILTIEYCGMVTTGYYASTFDSLYITLMLHTCAMFDVLSQKLEAIKINDFDNKRYKLPQGNTALVSKDEMIHLHLTECVKLHLRCIKYAERLNSKFSVSFIPDLFLGVLLASASAYKFVTSINDLDQLLQHGMIYLTQTLRIFAAGFIGQLLSDHSNYVNYAACNNRWYELPEKSKKLLLILMMRSFKPSQFFVAKLFRLNIDLFSKVTRTCLSYCTVMLSIQNS